MTDTPTLLKARVQRLHSERARKLEMLRRQEWAFDKEPIAEVMTRIHGLRAEVSELERQICMQHALIQITEATDGVMTMMASHEL